MQEPQELGLLIDLSAAKARMCLVRGALALRRTLACILGRQRAGDDEHLAEAAALAGSDDHATDLRVERQLGKLAADRGQLQGVVDRAEFGKQLVAVGDHLRLRRVDEGKSSTSPSLSDFMRRITPASDERRISGSVWGGRLSKSSSS